jgi:hypothetical protein
VRGAATARLLSQHVQDERFLKEALPGEKPAKERHFDYRIASSRSDVRRGIRQRPPTCVIRKPTTLPQRLFEFNEDDVELTLGQESLI